MEHQRDRGGLSDVRGIPFQVLSDYITTHCLLEEKVRPTTPIATIATRATLSMLGVGKNGGIIIASAPFCSNFDVIRNPNAVPAKNNPCCDGQYEFSDPFQGVRGRFGLNEVVLGVEHEMCPSLKNLNVATVLYRRHS